MQARTSIESRKAARSFASSTRIHLGFLCPIVRVYFKASRPISIREAARRVQRDVKAVNGDVTGLLNVGVISSTADGRVEFPFDAVKVEFMLQAA